MNSKDPEANSSAFGTFDALLALAAHWKRLIVLPLLIGLAALGWAFWTKPVFTAKTSFIPPPQQQSAAASALASLGSAAAALAGSTGGLRTPADQYAGLLQSETVARRIIEKFHLREVYEKEFFVDTKRILDAKVNVSIAKKEGIISIEVDDTDPQRAADMANAYVAELQRLTSSLALTESQQRRSFFEKQLKQTKQDLTDAQQALQQAGVTAGVLKAEPKAAVEQYAKLKAQVTATEIQVQSLRGYMSESSAEYKQATLQLFAMREQLSKLERDSQAPAEESAAYISKYRQFKYQETLFDLFSRQYELARLDEMREGAAMQVVDPAVRPERKSKPKRALIAIYATLFAFVVLAAFTVGRAVFRKSGENTETAEQRRALLRALRRPAKQT